MKTTNPFIASVSDQSGEMVALEPKATETHGRLIAINAAGRPTFSDDGGETWINGSPDEPAPSPTKPEGLEYPAIVLKATAKYSGDGWKDRTKQGDVAYVWSHQLPEPYAAGQHRRINNSVWSVDTEQWELTPADPAEVTKWLEAEETRKARSWLSPVSSASGEPKRDIGITQEWFERKVKLEEGHEIGAGAEIPDGCVVEQDITTNPPTWFYQIGRGMAVSQGGYRNRTEAVNALHTCLSAPLSDASDTVRVKREIYDFLMGAGALEGVHFGDKHPDERGAFWWRSRLRASLNGGALSDWLSMETAPRDGSWFIGWQPAKEIQDTVTLWAWKPWGCKEDIFVNAIDVNGEDDQPTHWMPLPAPPLNTGGKGNG